MYALSMWKPSPSATSVTPISSRKASASILVVGWRAMKPATVPEAAYMMPTAITTAAIMTSTFWAMPMAVTIESMENTMSMAMICTMMAANDPLAATVGTPSWG